MIMRKLRHVRLFLLSLGVAILLSSHIVSADPSKYPQFAQQKLPENVTPAFIRIEELVLQLKSGAKPVIIDVRTEEEYREAHIPVWPMAFCTKMATAI
jgi:hypothetical protein